VARPNLPRIRKICLSLPEATEVEAWGAPTFRIGKIFAMYSAAENHHGAGREGIWVKTDHFTQDLLVRGQPSRYFSPPYVGPQGWTGVYLDGDTDWIATTILIRDAYRVTAPKRLAILVPDDDAPMPRLAAAKPVKNAAKKAVKKPVKKASAKKPAPRKKR
jgi:predicted DNA-binding protein (MmcQ/YjbR family)